MDISQLWDEYVGKVYNNFEVSETQYRETRLAFYAGAWAAMNSMIQISEQDEITAVGNIEKLRVDIESFLQRELGRQSMSDRQEDSNGRREADNYEGS